MYTPAPNRAELEGLGLTLEDLDATEIYLDNLPAYNLFCYMGTQWNVGMAGATGLRYEVAHHKLDRMKLDPEEYEDRMDDLRIMEAEALTAMREAQKEK
jgi:hypothetical protein